eukprot:TRINITY_DN40567_c0_g1_i1.p1 TRINITY_DN40567_c0_g1~~TRINITY_DN40567_c0_g1_i1.p1  ORF type:complete len:930 (+),score=285.84 TRINITY_DN40567_c0_g1_i1:56-2791(+)
MALAVAQLVASLEAEDFQVRVNAVRVLARGAVRGDGGAVELLARRAETDKDEDVRQEALKALRKLAYRGDKRAVGVACRLLEDADEDVRKEAAKTVQHLHAAGDRETMATLVRVLIAEESSDIRDEVSAALEADHSPAGVSAALDALLPAVGQAAAPAAQRNVAAKQLHRLAPKGHAASLAAATALLAEADDYLRYTGTRAVSKLAKEGDASAVAALLGMTKDADEDIRSEALEGLARIAAKGDEAVLTAATAALEDEESSVREAAVAVFKALLQAPALPRLREAARDVALRLSASDGSEMRLTGLQALALVAAHGDIHAVETAEKYLEDGDEELREAALQALAGVLPAGSREEEASSSHFGEARHRERLLRCVAERLALDEEEGVRSCAAESLARMSEVGDAAALRGLLAALADDADSSVRAQAADAVATVAKPFDQEATAALSKALLDESSVVMEAAARALARRTEGNRPAIWAILDPIVFEGATSERLKVTMWLDLLAADHERAAETLTCMLHDRDDGVREQASEALELLLIMKKTDVATVLGPLERLADTFGKDPPLRLQRAWLETVTKPHILGRGGRRAAKLLSRGFEEARSELRASLPELLGRALTDMDHLLEEEDEAFIEAVREAIVEECAKRLSSEVRAVQKTAVQTLAAALRERGAPVAVEIARKHALHDVPRLKRAGLELLGLVAAPFSLEAVRLAAEALEHEDEKVRDAAVYSLGLIMTCGVDPLLERLCPGSHDASEALALVESRLQHASEHVRVSAAEAIGGMVQRGDAGALDLLLPALEDVDADVRWATLGALAKVAEKGDERCRAALFPCLGEKHEEEVRVAALKVAMEVVDPGDAAMIAAIQRCIDESPEESELSMVATQALVVLCPGQPPEPPPKSNDSSNGYAQKPAAAAPAA